MAFLTIDDLENFIEITNPIKAQAMIDDASAIAVLVAPCLADEDDLTAAQVAAVKAVLRGAIIRWNDAGSGAIASETAGPFSQTLDTRQQRKAMFWPAEIEQLQQICSGTGAGGIFSIDTVPGCGPVIHADICALNFGATYCSCGAVLTGMWPLWEQC
jgi:hypothetical protein